MGEAERHGIQATARPRSDREVTLRHAQYLSSLRRAAALSTIECASHTGDTLDLLEQRRAVKVGTGELSIATFNVENLDPSDGAPKFAELAT